MNRQWSLLMVGVLCAALLVGLVSCRRGGGRAPGVGPRPVPQTPSGPQAQPGASSGIHPHQLLTGEAKESATRGPRVQAVTREPELRIRIERQATTLRLGGSETLVIGPGQRDQGRASARSFAGPVSVRHDGAGFVLTDARGSSLRWPLSTLHVTTQSGEIAVDDGRFPGSIELVALYTEGKYTGYMDAVNYVGMEQYLPGVLSQEMYPKWDLEAYKAQAVAARSYAIWEMNLPVRTASHFDLEAGEASQAYIGSKAHPTARQAVIATSGMVLVNDSRVLPAFYSSCSGGVGQDATAAFPGRVADLAPLRGGSQGNWGQASTKFSWGPTSFPKPRLIASMRSWGEANKHPIARLQGIADVQVTGRTAAGRPTGFAVIDTTGARYTLDAEQLRVAANRAAPGQPTDLKLWSSFVEVRVLPDAVVFTGRGFGHGVGMCQFGAQGMAAAGQPYNAILGFYYPGAEIRRVY